MYVRTQFDVLVNLDKVDFVKPMKDPRQEFFAIMAGYMPNNISYDTSIPLAKYEKEHLAQNSLNNLCGAISKGDRYFSFK